MYYIYIYRERERERLTLTLTLTLTLGGRGGGRGAIFSLDLHSLRFTHNVFLQHIISIRLGDMKTM